MGEDQYALLLKNAGIVIAIVMPVVGLLKTQVAAMKGWVTVAVAGILSFLLAFLDVMRSPTGNWADTSLRIFGIGLVAWAGAFAASKAIKLEGKA